jgi:hypothetical protein
MVMGPGNTLLQDIIKLVNAPGTPPPTTTTSPFSLPPPPPSAVPISIWQLLISNLIKIYLQAYQLNSSATIKSGDSVGDKEASHMRTLENANTLAGKKGKITDFKPLSEAAWGLIDLEGDPEVMSIEDYYFSIQHLVSLLKLKFPHLMHSYQAEMLAPIVKKPLTDDHQDYMIVMGYNDVKTVGQMLDLYEFDIKSKALEGFKFVGRDVKKDDFTLPTISTYGVATQFNAHVALVPGENTTAPKVGSGRTSQLMGGALLKTTVNAYGPEELDVRSIAISNVDRPQTKFKTVQRSHTVAWTLVRHHIMSHADKPLTTLLQMMIRNLGTLKSDISYKAGEKFATTAVGILEQNAKKKLAVHEWEALVSRFVVWYAIAYQIADSSAYDTGKKATGHGESSAMRVLRENEYSLESDGELLDKESVIVEKAAKLFDAFVVNDLKVKHIKKAYRHWQDALEDGFPHLWSRLESKFKQELLDTEITKKGKTLDDFM